MKTVVQLILIGVFTLSVGYSSAQTKFRVNNSGVNAPFTTIDSAVLAASAGDTIIVESSDISYGSVVLDKTLVVFGTGYFLPDNPKTQDDERAAMLDGLSFTAAAAGSNVAGLTIEDVTINANDVILERCYITGRIVVGDLGQVLKTQIKKNFIESTQAVLIDLPAVIGLKLSNNFIHNEGGPADISVLMGNSSALILNNLFFGEPESIFRNCSVRNNYFQDASVNDVLSSNVHFEFNAASDSWISAFPGVGNLDLSLQYSSAALPDTLFTDNIFSRDGKYQLSSWPGNELSDGGFGGQSIGIYGGTDPYVKSGMPKIPSIYDFDPEASGSPSGGLDVNVKVKGHK